MAFIRLQIAALTFAVLSLVLSAFLLGYLHGIRETLKTEVICDHPEWTDSGYAAVSAVCEGGRLVTVLD